MNPYLTEIAYILDRPGSMEPMKCSGTMDDQAMVDHAKSMGQILKGGQARLDLL